MTCNGSHSNPSGINSTATTPAGMVTRPIRGTDMRFAASPYCASMLKCAAPTGAVAKPATADEVTTPKAPFTTRGQPCPCPRNMPKTATSAVVAAKDIWNPGDSNASGRSTRTTSAAIASARSDMARRSATSASSATAVITKARSVAIEPPDNVR